MFQTTMATIIRQSMSIKESNGATCLLLIETNRTLIKPSDKQLLAFFCLLEFEFETPSARKRRYRASPRLKVNYKSI